MAGLGVQGRVTGPQGAGLASAAVGQLRGWSSAVRGGAACASLPPAQPELPYIFLGPHLLPSPPSSPAVGELARRFSLGAEMINGVLVERVASGAIRGRLEAGVIYTQGYLARIKAQLR